MRVNDAGDAVYWESRRKKLADSTVRFSDVERIQSLPDPQEVDACFAALSADAGAADLLTQIRKTWVDNVDAHLRQGDASLAVVNMDLLLERGGLVDALRARGYSVDAP